MKIRTLFFPLFALLGSLASCSSYDPEIPEPIWEMNNISVRYSPDVMETVSVDDIADIRNFRIFAVTLREKNGNIRPYFNSRATLNKTTGYLEWNATTEKWPASHKTKLIAVWPAESSVFTMSGDTLFCQGSMLMAESRFLGPCDYPDRTGVCLTFHPSEAMDTIILTNRK